MRKAPLAALAADMVLHYAEENQKKPLSHVQPLSFYQVQDFMVIDEVTKRNLELTQSLFEQGKKGSLFWVLDETMTADGQSNIEGVVELSADRCRGDRASIGRRFGTEGEE